MKKLANINNFENIQNKANNFMNVTSDLSVFNFDNKRFDATYARLLDICSAASKALKENKPDFTKKDAAWVAKDYVYLERVFMHCVDLVEEMREILSK